MRLRPNPAHTANLAASLAAALLALSLGAGVAAAQGGRAAAGSGPAPPSTRLYLAALDAGPVAAGHGQLLGMVTDGAGRPLPGALVEVRPDGVHPAAQRQRTGQDGLFRLDQLVPGVYYVQVAWNGQATPRQRVTVHASERALLLLDLPALLRSARFGAPSGTDPDQAFDWALRQASIWRPILRWDGDAEPAPALAGPPVEGFVTLTAGGTGSAFAAPDLATVFRVDTRLWDGEAVSFRGSLGANLGGGDSLAAGGGSDTRVEANFHSTDPANAARLHLAVRQVALPGATALPALRVFSANYANALDFSPWLGDGARLQFGTLVNAVSMTDTVTTFSPYVRAILPLSDAARIELRAASAVPPLQFGHDSAELQDPTPRVTLDHNRARLEHAHHQEVRYEDQLTPATVLSGAVFAESFSRAAINGAFGAGMSAAAGTRQDLLPDLFNNMFVANGGDYSGWGYRLLFDQKLGGDWRADLGFASGPALVPASRAWGASLAPSLLPARVGAVTVKLSGTAPLTHTSIVCSYRGLSRLSATGVDLYDDTPGQADSYANIYLRQPLPRLFGGGNRIAALLEIHNLLAQGYVPMVSRDGGTLILVQNARALRGGLTISF